MRRAGDDIGRRGIEIVEFGERVDRPLDALARPEQTPCQQAGPVIEATRAVLSRDRRCGGRRRRGAVRNDDDLLGIDVESGQESLSSGVGHDDDDVWPSHMLVRAPIAVSGWDRSRRCVRSARSARRCRPSGRARIRRRCPRRCRTRAGRSRHRSRSVPRCRPRLRVGEPSPRCSTTNGSSSAERCVPQRTTSTVGSVSDQAGAQRRRECRDPARR